MTAFLVNRKMIVDALVAALEPESYILAMWEAGSTAFDRTDDWSDIDLQIDVEDDRVNDVFSLVENTLSALSPIDLKYELAQPTWHGHAQAFYRLRDASPYLLLDFVAMKHSNNNKFLQAETHGQPQIHFDKAGVVVSPPFDQAAFLAALTGRVVTLKQMFELFKVFPLKEIKRGNSLEALGYYQGQVLRPLIEVLRIRYAPARYNFHTRYIYYDLPADLVHRIEPLFFVPSAASIPALLQQAEMLFWETVQQIEQDGIQLN